MNLSYFLVILYNQVLLVTILYQYLITEQSKNSINIYWKTKSVQAVSIPKSRITYFFISKDTMYIIRVKLLFIFINY